MNIKNLLTLTLALTTGVSFKFMAPSVSEKKLTRISEIQCALACHADPEQSAYFFEDRNQSFTGNCILLGSQYFEYECPVVSFSNKSGFRFIDQTNDKIFTTSLTPQIQTKVKAMKSGFNKTFDLDGISYYFKEIFLEANHSMAMKACLAEGGILPMEDSDEFVEQMSILSGDGTNFRFISLSEEESFLNERKSLVWTLGKKIWTEGEDFAKCPRCSRWNFRGQSRTPGATINPVSKKYDEIPADRRFQRFHCQYIGDNIGLGKHVVGSSSHSPSLLVEMAVDGNTEVTNYWHSSNKLSDGEWITIDLGDVFTVTNVLFLGRSGVPSTAARTQNMTVWIGNSNTIVNVSLNVSGRNLYALYPYKQFSEQLSGVTCNADCKGQFITIRNAQKLEYMHFTEVAVFGFRVG